MDTMAIPEGATHYISDGVHGLYYKYKEVKYNDGTARGELFYHSSFGIWMPAMFPDKTIPHLLTISKT